ncbi:hypothetical protein B296_00056968 [Ensete ventricosum]|uniref:Uncharacterized protein n=1 Tax=Ensete ventricosum TaxID=4639 RepID=A0A426XT71_ENSVE|nr:hypothetical protein B296_00056968 [Ensete ventricosum]
MELTPPPPPPPSSLSLVSRAKTALHSAAAKAEKVLTDIKADLKIDRGRVALPHSSSHNRRTLGVSKYSLGATVFVSLLQLSCLNILHFYRSVKNHKSINDLLASSVDPSSNKEKTGLSFSVMKSLVLREKEDKEINSSMCLLFKSGKVI